MRGRDLVRLPDHEVDFLFRAAKIVVEVDGRHHEQPMMRLAGAHRDVALEAAGYLVLRCGWADVHAHHERTATEILSQRRLRHRVGA